jgi:hypothetical protein
MTPRDFGLMTLVCLIWAANSIISKLVITNLGAPPMFYAALRFAVVLAVVWPWLRNAPRPLWRMILVGLCMGCGTFALVFFDRVRLLLAWCELRQDFRSFRTDRIIKAEVMEARYPARRQALLKTWREAQEKRGEAGSC